MSKEQKYVHHTWLQSKGLPGSPVVKTLLSDTGGAGLFPGQGAIRSHVPHSQKTETYSRSRMATNSLKTSEKGPH